MEPNVPRVRGQAHRTYGLFDDRPEIDGLHGQSHPPTHHARHVEQIIEKPNLGGGVSQDDLNGPARLLLAQLSTLQHLGPSRHRIERIPELVGQRGEKFVFRAIRRFRFDPGRLRLSIESRSFHRDSRKPRHDLGAQKVGATVAASRLRDREGDGSQRSLTADQGDDHPRLRTQLLEDAQLISVHGLCHQARLGHPGHEDGSPGLNGGRHPFRRVQIEAVSAPHFVDEGLFRRIDVGTGHPADRAVRLQEVDRAQIAQRGDGQPGQARKYSFMVERGPDEGAGLGKKGGALLLARSS